MLSVLNLKLLSVLNFISITGPEEYIKKIYKHIILYFLLCNGYNYSTVLYSDLGNLFYIQFFFFLFCVIGLTWVPNQEIEPTISLPFFSLPITDLSPRPIFLSLSIFKIMGCRESKLDVVTGNTVVRSKES